MALPMLVGGSECGPSNPLQGLSKRYDQDRGVQQDFFGAARAGSSRETFRSQNVGASDQEAQRFFAQPNPGQLVSPSEIPAFDVSAMRAALPPQPHTPSFAVSSAGPAAWAADFMMLQPASASRSSGIDAQHQHQQLQHSEQLQPMHGPVQPQSSLSWNPAASAFRVNTMPGFAPQMHTSIPGQQISWDKEFSAQELNLTPSTLVEEVVQQVQQESQQQGKEFDGDELARTAGQLLETIKHEQNPKFQKSQFLGLMRQLRDGEVIVEGNKVVGSDGTRTSSMGVDVKGKGREMPLPSFATGRVTYGAEGMMEGVEQQLLGNVEDPNDAYFRQENADYTKYWDEADQRRQHMERAATGQQNPEVAMWDQLQEDWDTFEATATGIKPVSRYVFQTNNPYILGESSRSQHHMMHTGERQSMLESVLEMEAAVQRDPLNASIWYELGVKQQENEREGKALQALQRAVELDPSLLPAWLALAISYTNDNDRQGTYQSISQWVNRNDKYRASADAFRAANPLSESAVMTEKFTHLIDCLIAMARSNTGEVDADIQIALAVLLNSHEEYDKAQDCFRTALAVRPEDWLLYNRVGATMANSGRAEEALQYYYRALELNPGYIRARFNLGISCMNLKRYDEAAQHILDALILQDSDASAVDDASPSADKRDVISQALWVSLRTTCLHLQRPDLATLCDQKDLDTFRQRFYE